MSHAHHHNKVPFCLNCHYPLADDDKFCPNCGQENRDSHISMHDLWHEITHYFTHVDNKIFVTIRDLFIPGKLTQEFFQGHRKRYVPPITLFFVLGVILPYVYGQVFKVRKDNNFGVGMISTKKVYQRDILASINTLVKQDSTQYSIETRRAFDTVLIGFYKNLVDITSKKDTSYMGISVQYFLNRDRIRNTQTSISLIKTAIPIDQPNNPQSIALQKTLSDYEKHLAKSLKDSMDCVAAMARLGNKTTEAVLKEMELAVVGYEWGKKRANPNPKILTLDSVLRTPAGYDPVQARINARLKVIQRDSATLNGITISEIDLLELPIGEVLDKYNITDFKTKAYVKSYAKYGKSGIGGIFKAYGEKASNLNAFAILPLAAVFLFLYRRSKRLYVEHVIFMIHYTCFNFVLVTFQLLGNQWLNFVIMFASFLFLLFALKRVYAQDWAKTIFKGIAIYLCSMVMGLLLMALWITISAIL